MVRIVLWPIRGSALLSCFSWYLGLIQAANQVFYQATPLVPTAAYLFAQQTQYHINTHQNEILISGATIKHPR